MVDSFEFPAEKAKVDDEPLPPLIFNEFAIARTLSLSERPLFGGLDETFLS